MNDKIEFEWPRSEKVEYLIELQINEYAEDYVKEFFGVDEIEDLSKEQADSILEFIENYHWEYSPILLGLRSIWDAWESNNYDM